jgi:predicted DNA-binding transcriptional regulator YafY
VEVIGMAKYNFTPEELSAFWTAVDLLLKLGGVSTFNAAQNVIQIINSQADDGQPKENNEEETK